MQQQELKSPNMTLILPPILFSSFFLWRCCFLYSVLFCKRERKKEQPWKKNSTSSNFISEIRLYCQLRPLVSMQTCFFFPLPATSFGQLLEKQASKAKSGKVAMATGFSPYITAVLLLRVTSQRPPLPHRADVRRNQNQTGRITADEGELIVSHRVWEHGGVSRSRSLILLWSCNKVESGPLNRFFGETKKFKITTHFIVFS